MTKKNEKLTRQKVIDLIALAEEKNEPLNLEGQNLKKLDLSGLNLSNANLRGVSLKGAKVDKTDFTFADLRQANVQGVNFMHSCLLGARIHGIRLKKTYLPIYVFKQEGKQKYVLGDLTSAKVSKNIKDWHYAREVAMLLKYESAKVGRMLESKRMFLFEQRIIRGLTNPFRRVKWAEDKTFLRKLSIFTRFGLRWLVAWIADLTCGYGESVFRVLSTFVLTQGLFILGYSLFGSILYINGGTATDLMSVINFGLAAMTTTNLQNLVPANQCVEIVMSFQVIIGIAVTGLLGFVLGNRIRYSA